MPQDVDELIRSAGPSPDPNQWDALEAEVWRRVGAAHARTASVRLTTGALVIAVMIGVVGGGLASAARSTTPSDLSVLTVEAGLEPFGLARDVG